MNKESYATKNNKQILDFLYDYDREFYSLFVLDTCLTVTFGNVFQKHYNIYIYSKQKHLVKPIIKKREEKKIKNLFAKHGVKLTYHDKAITTNKNKQL